MSDEKERELERLAATGDVEAAERLYWSSLRTIPMSQLLDRLIESALTTRGGLPPDLWQKLGVVRGKEVRGQTPEAVEAEIRAYDVVRVPRDLHRIPRQVCAPGFTTYVQSSMSVHRMGNNGQWTQVASLSAEPRGRPFLVVDTLAQRDALEVGAGAGCLVLANMGIYESGVDQNQYSGHQTVSWRSIRFERGA